MANVLVIGSGAREHAIAATMLKSSQVENVYCAPGNPGMTADNIQLVDIDELDFAKLVAFAQRKAVDLTFVGPEVPLAMGVVDRFQAAGLRVFGPNQSSARLESDKTFAKNFMIRNGIPTAKFKTFKDAEAAENYARTLTLPVVVKENGLAAGKGVSIVKDNADLRGAIDASFQKSDEILIEEFLKGEEFSLMLFVGGDKKVIFPISQDHKKIHEGEVGPNTGGMGAYSPVPHINQQVQDDTIQKKLLSQLWLVWLKRTSNLRA